MSIKKKQKIDDDFLNYQWMEIGDIREIDIPPRMMSADWTNKDLIPDLIIQTCRSTEYLHFFVRYILNINLAPYQAVALKMLWTKALPMFIATRGGGKSFLLAVYICCRAVLHQGCRIAVVGASLRQSMVIFGYVEQIWDSAPILRDICGGVKKSPKRDQHMAKWNPGKSKVTFLPLGDGSKIRGQRANYIIADEFASVPEDVFETVVRGFAAVKSDNTFESMVTAYKDKTLKEMGVDSSSDEIAEEMSETGVKGVLGSNQIVIAGTAYYQFNHFYTYFNKYRAIIETKGDKDKLKHEFPDMEISDDLDPSDYAILRIPYNLIPAGIMDQKILDQGRSTMDPMIFDMEYGTIFPTDSEGFYLASWIARCTCPVSTPEGEINFAPQLGRVKDAWSIMGIDPASEDDNFSISITDVYPTFTAYVYQWTTNRKEFESMKRQGLIKSDIKDYNTFVIRHIRDLMKRFDVKLMVVDSGGGGRSLAELLKDPDKIESDEEPVYDMEDENTQGLKGLHILKLVEFSNYEWYREAHWHLRKELQALRIIFPAYDAARATASEYQNVQVGNVYDTLEDCYVEIEQAKQETTLIQQRQTPKGRETFDVPRIKGLDAEQIQKRLKKDRFTSLMLSVWGRRYLEENEYIEAEFVGGAAVAMQQKNLDDQPAYHGPGVKKMRNADLYNTRYHNSVSNPNGHNNVFF